jgi:hypothetical protein
MDSVHQLYSGICALYNLFSKKSSRATSCTTSALTWKPPYLAVSFTILSSYRVVWRAQVWSPVIISNLDFVEWPLNDWSSLSDDIKSIQCIKYTLVYMLDLSSPLLRNQVEPHHAFQALWRGSLLFQPAAFHLSVIEWFGLRSGGPVIISNLILSGDLRLILLFLDINRFSVSSILLYAGSLSPSSQNQVELTSCHYFKRFDVLFNQQSYILLSCRGWRAQGMWVLLLFQIWIFVIFDPLNDWSSIFWWHKSIQCIKYTLVHKWILPSLLMEIRSSHIMPLLGGGGSPLVAVSFYQC